MDRSDSQLWSQSRRGDKQAFGQLFERHAATIYNYCFRRTGDWAVAEDLVAITFLEAWRHRGADVEPGKVLPWLYGIATNIVRNRRRAQRRYAAALRAMPLPHPSPDFAAEAEERADASRQMRTVLSELARLPRSGQDVIALSVWSELSYEDTAAALGIPVGTVRSRLSRARNKLRSLDASLPPEHADRRVAKEVLEP